jgi:hypothetical protein
MFSVRPISILAFCAFLLGVLIIANPMACSSSTSNGSGGTTFTISNLGKGVELTSGVMTEVSFPVTVDLDSVGGSISSLEVNLQAHVSAVTLSVPGVTTSIPFIFEAVESAHADITGSQLFLRVGSAEQEATVCTEGELYGPFDITLADNFQPASVVPATAEATRHTLDVINTGSYSICVQIMPTVTAVADLNSLTVDIGNCTEAPADISGRWSGPYECIGTCPESGTVTLDILQNANDPAIASYTDDSGASYQGRVCGNRFSFRGGVTESYDESGTFILNADGSASKTSTYISIGASTICSGTCTDTLDRI